MSFVGHTHQPFIWRENSFDRVPSFNPRNGEASLTISVKEKSIINVGSVGQPRDGDPRASYAIYDTENNTVTLYKIPYEIERTVANMQRNGFDSNAYERLIYGR